MTGVGTVVTACSVLSWVSARFVFRELQETTMTDTAIVRADCEHIENVLATRSPLALPAIRRIRAHCEGLLTERDALATRVAELEAAAQEMFDAKPREDVYQQHLTDDFGECRCYSCHSLRYGRACYRLREMLTRKDGAS